MPEVYIDLSNLPDGEEVEVPNLGVFENGVKSEVDEGRWERFLALQPGAEESITEGSLTVTDETQLQATKDHHAQKEAEAEAETEETASTAGTTSTTSTTTSTTASSGSSGSNVVSLSNSGTEDSSDTEDNA